MVPLLGKIKQKLFRTNAKFQRCQKTIALTETGEKGDVVGITDEKKSRGSKKLLIVGRESYFSEEIIDYALEMAQRMSYDVLALNTAPLSCETFKMVTFSNRVCEKFKSQSEENAKKFREKAAKKGIALDHIVMFDESEKALKCITRKNEDIAFVISETVEDRPESKTGTGDQHKPNLYVYAMA